VRTGFAVTRARTAHTALPLAGRAALVTGASSGIGAAPVIGASSGIGVALVTGASSGIGAATALLPAAAVIRPG
jgi:NADP-dependent 3-hydroxy acid dehydrogenase YdfG